MMIFDLAVLKLDFGPMARHERNAMEKGDLFSGKQPLRHPWKTEESSPNGRVLDLVFPILVLIVCCITGMIYSGGFFDGVGFVERLLQLRCLRRPDAGLCGGLASSPWSTSPSAAPCPSAP